MEEIKKQKEYAISHTICDNLMTLNHLPTSLPSDFSQHVSWLLLWLIGVISNFSTPTYFNEIFYLEPQSDCQYSTLITL